MKLTLLLFLSLISSGILAQDVSSIPYPFHVVQADSSNELMMIDSGSAAFEQRLQMIRRAAKTIEVEYFCYNTDLASKIFTQELINARNRGVKVRVLIDKAVNVFVFNSYYARELSERGIEVRYFNNASLLNFGKSIYRNHRKLLAIDGKEALTGGRNLGDEYFDMAEGLNYSDRDLHVKGPIVKAMIDSFNEYFEHKMTERPKFPKSRTNKKALAAKAFFEFSDEELETKRKIEALGQFELMSLKSHVCPVTTFATDAPGGGWKGFVSQKFSDKIRFLRKVLLNKISNVDKSILISTPYFLTNSDSKKMMDVLLEKNVEVNIYTNSLSASDATYMSVSMYAGLKKWNKKGINFFFHTGEYPDDRELMSEEIRKGQWSDHAKTHVYESHESSEVMIGTFNMHNRSSYYDSEMAIFCKGNDEFTKEVKASIQKRMDKGLYINDQYQAVNKDGKIVNKYGISSKRVKDMAIMKVPVFLFKFML